jgi:predicted molibdopterin-dependent oxidoreductase YjgC
MKHKHHIIPKHMGGTDDESNIIELTIEEHAEAKIAHSEIMKRRKVCQYCGMESNASNVTRHEKLCKLRTISDGIN